MANRTKRKSSSKKKSGGKNPRSGKLIAVILVFLGFLLLVELVSYVINKAGTSKVLFAQDALDFSGNDQPCGPFKAWDVMATADGRIVVSDQGNKRLLVFDTQGKFLQEIGQKQAGPTTISEFSCLTSDATGNIYVMDTWNALIRGFDPKGSPVLNVDLNGKGFYGPRGVAWDGANFTVADTGSHRLVKVASSGSVLASWGTHGSGRDAFNSPYQVVSDGQGHYDVVDRDNNRIQILDTEGHFTGQISLGSPPQAEAVDAARKILYVTSLDGKFVRSYTLDGKLNGTLTQGDLKNSHPLPGMNALSVLPNGDLLAAQNDRISIFHILPTAPGQ